MSNQSLSTHDAFSRSRRFGAGAVCRVSVVALVLFLAPLHATAADGGSAVVRAPSAPEARREAALKKLMSARAERLAERERAGLRVFVDESGVSTFTDKAWKYRDDDRYTEVKIDFDPIVVAGRYKGRTSASRYTDDEIADLVTQYAKKYGLRESLVYAVIKVESDFNRSATSKKGASGLMQLMPGTARDMGVTDINDPAQNIAGGTQYLSKLLDLFDGNEKLALAGYNAGPGKVKKFKGIPPYEETQNYVRNVLAWDKKYASGAARPGGSRRSSTRVASTKSPGAKTASAKTVIYFHSGLKQEVDAVVLKDDYYHVQIRNRTFPVHKRSVKKIEEPA